jgi:hypothetical protein
MICRALLVALLSVHAAGCHRVFALDDLPVDAPGPPRCLADDYEDGLFDGTEWEFTDPADPENTVIRLVESAGRLEFQIEANEVGGNGLTTILARDLTNAWAEVEVVPGLPLDTFTEIALVRDLTNYYRFGIASSSSGTELQFQRAFEGSISNASSEYDPAKHVHLRIRHDQASRNVFFETSMDRTAWATQHFEAALLPVELLRVRIQVRAFVAGAARVVRLDNALVQTPDCVP